MDQRERDRSGRREKHSRFTDAEDHHRDRSIEKPRRKGILYISNIPPGTAWTSLKDFFRRKAGDVAFVEIKDSLGKIEFSNIDSMRRALNLGDELMFEGSKLIVNDSEFASPPDRRHPMGGDFGRNGSMPPGPPPADKYNTYGLSIQFLEGLGIEPPLVPHVFVTNLDFAVDVKMLKEVFKLAGKIRQISMPFDKEGKSRGFSAIRYSHPVEAVQAISMFNNQYLLERKISVRLDHNVQDKNFRIPHGLRGIGPGLGPNGDPLEDVANNLPNIQANKPNSEPPAMSPDDMLMPPDDMLMPNQMNAMGPAPNMGMPSMGMGNMSAINPATLQALNLLQNQLLLQSQGGVPHPVMSNMGFGMNSSANAGPMNSMNSHSGFAGGSNEGKPMDMNKQSYNRDFHGFAGGSNEGKPMDMNKKSYSRDFDDQDRPNRMGNASKSRSNSGPNKSDSHENTISQKISDMVFINNLPPNISWQILREKFGECGEVKCAELTGSNSAIVRFQRDWDAQRAVKMFDGTLIDEHIINCRFY